MTFTADTHNCDKLDSVSVNLSLSSVSTLYSVTTHELVLFILIINENIMLLLHFSIISCRRCFVKNSTLKYAAKLFCSQILSYHDRCLRCFTHVLMACFNTTHRQSCTTSIHNLFNWSVSSNFHLIWTGWSRPQIRGFNEKFSEWCGRFGEETSGERKGEGAELLQQRSELSISFRN